LPKTANDDPEQTENHFLRFSHKAVSLLELECVNQSIRGLPFEVLSADISGAIISCTPAIAKRLISLLGGSYKIARVIGNDVEDSVKQLPLPDAPKFEWTVSGYNCEEDAIQSCREEVKELLKKSGLGKSKFVPPSIESAADKVEDQEEEQGVDGREERDKRISEIKSSELARRIFDSENQGIDVVLHGGVGSFGPFLAYTVGVSDVDGFERRDFKRPYQDPRITLGARVARILCNLAAGSHRALLCDPFCGLGTILQEALVIGHPVLGIDKRSEYVFKARSNLEWVAREYSLPRSRIVKVLRYDSQRMDELPMQRCDCIASEPILLPTFKDNPTQEEASASIRSAGAVYERFLQACPRVLASKSSRIALISPIVVDSGGRSISLDLGESARKAGLRAYWPDTSKNRFDYPIKIETTKKKTVQRGINLFSPA